MCGGTGGDCALLMSDKTGFRAMDFGGLGGLDETRGIASSMGYGKGVGTAFRVGEEEGAGLQAGSLGGCLLTGRSLTGDRSEASAFTDDTGRTPSRKTWRSSSQLM